MGAPQTLPAGFQGWDNQAPQTLPADFNQWDAPKVPKPNAPQQSLAQDRLNGLATGIMDTVEGTKKVGKSIANQVYDVSTPGIAEQIYRHMQGLPNTLHELPGKMVLAFLAAGGLGPEIEATASKYSAPEAIQSATEEATRTPPELPEAFRGPGRTPKGPVGTVDNPFQGPIKYTPKPETIRTPPKLPEAFNGPGATYQSPAGSADNPFRSSQNLDQGIVDSVSSKLKVSPQAVRDALEDALGVKKPIPGVALKDQASAQSAKLPEGFTPTESSAIKGYRYSPERQELEAVAKTGEHYIHGDVSPEQFGKFVESPSRGKAWNELKGNATLVAKVINGKRIPVRPAVTE